MGTRAAFWIGDPTEIDEREWLGCIAWDGCLEMLPALQGVASEADFREVVSNYATERDDFAKPESGWPFPWADDVFVTDRTYAWFDGMLHVAHFRRPFVSLEDELVGEVPEKDDPAHENVPAPSEYNPTQPDSIMLVRIYAENR